MDDFKPSRTKTYQYKQNGSVLLIALIMVAVVAILSGSILYMLKINIVQNKAIESYSNARNSAFLSLKTTLEANDYLYTNTPINSSVKNYNSGNSTVTVTSTVSSDLNNAIYPDSVKLNNASAILQYHVQMQVTAQAQNQANYIAIVNAPSQYRANNNLAANDTQNVNIPIVIKSNLNSAQLDANSQLIDGQAGYIGTININNITDKVTYTDLNAINYDLTFDSQSTGSNYVLTQGWRLENGNWYWNIIIYDVIKSEAWQTEINLTSLKETPSNFSTLFWTKILDKTQGGSNEYNPNTQYPGGSVVVFDNQTFISIQPIDINQTPYSNPQKWILIIPANSYPNWNYQWNSRYQAGDIITYFGLYFIRNTSGGWTYIDASTITNNPSYWSNKQQYNPGDRVAYNGHIFVNIQTSNKNPYQDEDHWRIVKENDEPFSYFDSKVEYYPGDQVNYNGNTFINISKTNKNPYQEDESWRILIPENQIPYYNSKIRYYPDDKIGYNGKIYIANIPYNQTISPNKRPPNNGWLEVTS
ncbi:hypothetical protein [Cysteiniphilum sp. JM-1]|uniref:hypothetical protein n=1 Tax=Cysteiniphilum sp. JM-1 TaxID=2610891 RepID=UPI0012454FAD|nr:hypothetical protein [Cysteiniphilum sp. JM-1]